MTTTNLCTNTHLGLGDVRAVYEFTTSSRIVEQQVVCMGYDAVKIEPYILYTCPDGTVVDW